jgi:hypothetical protein
MNIGLEREQELFDCRLIENRYVSDRLERCDDFGAFGSGHDRTARAFLKGDLFIRVNTDDQHVAQLSRAREISNVANMQHIETAIRKNNSRAGFTGGCHTLD